MENILIRLIRVLTATPDIREALAEFLSELGVYYQADRAYIIEYDLRHDTLSNTFEWCAPGIESAAQLLQGIDLSIVQNWNQRFQEQGDFVITSVAEQLNAQEEDSRLLTQQGIDTLMAAPLMIGETIIGFVGVDNPRAQVGEPALLRATAGFVAVELDKRCLIEKMDSISCTDELTGAGNRNAYIERLEMFRREPPAALGVIDVDINGLSLLNAQYGYQYGDGVLRDMAALLRRCADGDVYRVGEDEFVVLHSRKDRAAFDGVCEKIRAEFAQIADYTATMGCTWWEKEVDLDLLFARVRERMEAEKAVYYHDTGTAQHAPRVGSMTAELLREIEDGRFRIYMQPQVDMTTGRVVGAEALLRKVDGDGRIILPGEFIPQYEALGVQMHLDMFVLQTVMDILAQLQKEGREMVISVNISRPMLSMPDMAKRIKGMLNSRGVRPEYLKLEFTESVAKDGPHLLSDVVGQLREVGVAVALDDFGTQYSNLSVVMDIGFDEIKLDKSLIDHVCTERRSQIVLQSVIDMCQRLGNRRIVAEGIERPEQSEKLQSMACRYGQGYLYYRPMPLDEFLKLI